MHPQQNTLGDRQTWYDEVRSCRRRPRTPWNELPVRRPLAIPDEYCLLEYYSCLAHARARMAFHGMLLMDAFRAFDDNRLVLSILFLFQGKLIHFFSEMVCCHQKSYTVG